MIQKYLSLLNGLQASGPAIIVWLVVALILIGAARVERAIEKENTLSIISSDTQTWSVLGATLIANEPRASQSGTQSSDTPLSLQDLHTSGQVMAQSLSGINYIAGRTHTRSSHGRTVQSVVIFKFDHDQQTPAAQTELASDGFNRVSSIAVDANGDVIIVGHTSSDNFSGSRLDQSIVNPLPYNPHTSKLFVARYSPDLVLLKSSFLDGAGHIIPQDLLIGPDGLVYITGSTNSGDFFTTPGAFSGALSATESPLVVDYGADSFVVALDSNLETIVASTLFGGNRDDYAYQLGIGANGNIVVAGNTGSADFPQTIVTNTGAKLSPQFSNIFISVFDPDLTVLVASSVWGSPTSDFLRAMYIDKTGGVHLCGHTTSDTFPVTGDFVDNNMKGGHYDAWYAQLDQNLENLQRAGYIGGANNDFCSDISGTDDGTVFLTLDTNSIELFGRAARYPGKRLRGGLLAKIAPSTDHQGNRRNETSIDLIAAFRSGSYTSIKGLTVSDQSIWITGFSEANPSDQFVSVGTKTTGQPRLIFAQLGPIKNDG